MSRTKYGDRDCAHCTSSSTIFRKIKNPKIWFSKFFQLYSSSSNEPFKCHGYKYNQFSQIGFQFTILVKIFHFVTVIGRCDFMWRCDIATLWRCVVVTLRRCDVATLWRYVTLFDVVTFCCCDVATLCDVLCRYVTLRCCDVVTLCNVTCRWCLAKEFCLKSKL